MNGGRIVQMYYGRDFGSGVAMLALCSDKFQMLFIDSCVPRSDLGVDGVMLLLFVIDHVRSHVFPSLQVPVHQPLAWLVDIDHRSHFDLQRRRKQAYKECTL